MGRRSDHSRAELREIFIAEGHRQMRETGYAGFSAREVAKRVGYSIGTVYNVFGSYDEFILAINGRTLELWRHMLQTRIAKAKENCLHIGVRAYFDFALENRHAWTALYDFRLPEDVEAPEYYQKQVRAIMDVIIQILLDTLPPHRASLAPEMAPSLLALVHGHCFFTLNGTFDILGENDALARCIEHVETLIEGG